MAFWLEQRGAGVALIIDGDLQFDSRDERVYHEALVLPALALAEARAKAPLTALICGGGDGLVARELLKSARVAAIDLVDYDAALVRFARSDLAAYNESSLDDPRVQVTALNALTFVERAREAGRNYDLIICDLTVPTDAESARLHSADWYESLTAILNPAGVIAANAVSPSGAPAAFAAICNSLRSAGLAAAPFRLPIPSFAAAGYGPDWGFILASRISLSQAQFAALELASPRTVLRDTAQAERMFSLPAALRRAMDDIAGYRAGSGELLIHLAAGPITDADAVAGGAWDTLAEPLLPIARLLPRTATEHPAHAAIEAVTNGTPLEEALRLVPNLHPGHAAAMIEEFCAEPERFLNGLDLRSLITRLLARASELPKAFVKELRRLMRRIRRAAGGPFEGLANREGLLDLGSRVLAVIALVVILANLALPDSVYGKGASSSSGAASGASVSALAHPSVSGKAPVAPPVVASDSGFRSNFASGSRAVDEDGTSFPSRHYYYYPSYYGGSRGYSNYRSGTPPTEKPKEEPALYKLTSDSEILSDGHVVVSVGDGSMFLLLDPELTVLTNTATGQPLLYLAPNPAQLWVAAKEVERQTAGLQMTAAAKQRWIDWYDWLDFLPGVSGDHDELKNVKEMQQRLVTARSTLGTVADARPPTSAPPAGGVVEVMDGVWLPANGSVVILLLPDGIAYMDGSKWYSDSAKTTPRTDPYPAEFKQKLMALLVGTGTDESATRSRLGAELALEQADLAEVNGDLVLYDQPGGDPNEQVDYGSAQVTRSEAIRLTKEAITRTQTLIAATTAELASLPAEVSAAKAARTMLAK